ncbi:MAG: hypothetical protein HZA61_03900 [Candidatus Eisenbacteria bacterium]|uniref:Uncharacterized protein n=1 Tax=Eiseniibacteriota bacterium TaxID=2212470 RepID=A0A933W7M6_UNCEI|nr:hypothetical protein [Candidatus Eisenbacteria bacterium]
MRKWIGWWWLCVIGAIAPAVPAAQAGCMQCTSEMWCAQSSLGGALCLADGNWCAMAGRCRNGGGFLDGFAMVQVTLLEDAPGAPGAPARVKRGAGAVTVGDAARRAARDRGAEPAIVFSAVGVLDGTSAVFRSRAGDGFVVWRERDGRGARVRVREWNTDRPGRVLADERLGEHDAMVVRVTLDGQRRQLVLQAPTLPEAEGREREARCRREIALSGAPVTLAALPFELQAYDE